MALGQGFAARVRKAWGWIMAGDESPAQAGANNEVVSENLKDVRPLSYRLVVIAILCVSALFIVVMLFFGWRGVIKDDAQVVAALTSAFGIIGTLVGAYFGIKSSNDARDTVENVHSKTTGAVQQAASAAQHAAGAAQQSAEKAADATSTAQQVSEVVERVADNAAAAAESSRRATNVAQQLSNTAQQLVQGGAEQTPQNDN
jgi:hypothetical protein